MYRPEMGAELIVRLLRSEGEILDETALPEETSQADAIAESVMYTVSAVVRGRKFTKAVWVDHIATYLNEDSAFARSRRNPNSLPIVACMVLVAIACVRGLFGWGEAWRILRDRPDPALCVATCILNRGDLRSHSSPNKDQRRLDLGPWQALHDTAGRECNLCCFEAEEITPVLVHNSSLKRRFDVYRAFRPPSVVQLPPDVLRMLAIDNWEGRTPAQIIARVSGKPTAPDRAALLTCTCEKCNFAVCVVCFMRVYSRSARPTRANLGLCPACCVPMVD